ncbi:BspA family leucine-rich repeat surface protein [Maribacter sp. 2210JD10-5]|uniref:BspA family leucine-rich repeat surface protein n=1 Tax=Maribacter sp. 2210JD10-5 TaxID=3386272 RepID=UPI0039BC7746
MTKKLFPLFLLFLSCNLFAQDFSAIWNTTNESFGSSLANEITIPTNPAYTTYNYDVDWGDGNNDTGVTGDITHTYSTPGNYTISISGTFPAIYFNNTGDKLKIIEILSWGTIEWQTMEDAFHGCENLNFDSIDAPDLSAVTTLQNMFRNCITFNGIVNNWDVSTIENMSGLFAGARVFNRPVDRWTTNAVTNMSETFSGANLFNEPLDNWRVDNVTDMSLMFSGAGRFNRNISNWNTTQVLNMSGAFRYTNSFNQPLNDWTVDNVTDMSNMFEGSAYDLPLTSWNVDKVTDMSGMFSQYSNFNQDINNWTVSAVTDMSQMFHRATRFNQPLENWDVSNVTNMSGMFDGFFIDMIFDQPLNAWDVSKVEDMSNMFRDCPSFNQPLNLWLVNEVTNMSGMFENVILFNQDITGWNVGKVENMSNMFRGAEAFNQPLNAWTPTAITNLSGMFSAASQFNQPLDTWDVTLVTNFSNMFQNATLFNQDLRGWVMDSATNMRGMFQNAAAFDLDLGSWNISNVSAMNDMLSNSGLSQENYDNTLIGWAAQTVRENISLGATGLNYCDALDERQDLIDNFSWNITGDIVNCSFVLCTELISPIDGDTNVPASANLTWAQTPGATGYYVTVRIERGGVTSTPFNDLQVVGGNTTGLNLEDGGGNDLLQPGDEVFVTVVPYNDTDGRATGCTEESFTVVPSWVNSPDAFKFTIDTRNLDRNSSGINQLRLEHNNTYRNDYNYSVDWGDDQFDNNVTSEITHTYPSPGIYTVSIIRDYPSHIYNSSNRDNLKLLSIDQWGTYEWKSMRQTAYFCENMVYNATDIPDLSQVTIMSSMFRRAINFNGDINNWDVGNVENMSNMFYQASIYNQPMDLWDVSSVTTMAQMLDSAPAFDKPIGMWEVGNVENMNSMFRGAIAFNQPLNGWDVIKVTDMASMFNNATSFNQPLNDWDVDNVTNMSSMFSSATAFNQPLNLWKVDEVLTMQSMFSSASAFNQNLNDWDVDKVTNMSLMFSSATSYDQPMNNWNVLAVTNMSGMFRFASTFDQNLNDWDVTNVIDMNSMFRRALAYNQPMDEWEVDSVVNMSTMFESAEAFDQPLNEWDVSAVANMSSMFRYALAFNQPLNSWVVSSVTLMPSMFEGTAAFNEEIGNWNVASVTNMQSMFKDALLFDQPIQSWDTGEVLTMQEMFEGAETFNQNINGWNVSFVQTMRSMFQGALTFNQDLDSWNVASVTDMESMFQSATAFNGAIGSWNVRGVTTMEDMFNTAIAFDQDISNWRVSGVLNMESMFQNATSYNQHMDSWILGTTNMRNFLRDATAFNQSLAEWDVSNITDMQNMLDNTAIERTNYDNILIAWSELTLTPGITFGALTLPYCDALEERQSIIDTYGWNIVGDVRDCPIPECTVLTSPLNGDTDVPVNTNITWEPALYARGYRLTVGTSPIGNDIVDDETINDETSYEFTSDFNTGDVVYVTIIPFNDEGDAVGPCTEESFTISSDPATIPDCTNLNEPLNGDNDVEITTDLSWNPISNADGYRLTVGTTTGGNDLVDDEDVGNSLIYEFSTDLPEDTDIFVTVTPYNDEGDAMSCVEESFDTELIPVPPSCTNLISPANNDTDVPIDTNLSWTPVDGATGYLVSVGTTSGGIEVENNIDVGNMTTFDISDDLLENRRYYVTIIPYNDVGDATGCIEETFQTGDSSSPPSCVLLSDPLNGAEGVTLDTNISWDGSGTADGYRLTVGTSSGGTEIFTGDLGDVTTFDLADDLPENTTIYVNITAYNVNGDSTGCTEQSFMTDGPPLCTSLIAPANLDTNVAINLSSIEWNASADADGYTLTVNASSSTANDVTALDIPTGTSYSFPNDFEQGETVTVTIIPYNEIGDAIGCLSENFTIKPVPNCTNLVVPANNAIEVPVDTDISWTPIADADGYRLTVNASSSTANNLTDVDVSTNTSYSFANEFEQGEIVTVTITPYNEIGNAIGCTSERFTIESVPDCTNLTIPANGDVLAQARDITWNAIANADGYRLTINGSNTTINNVTDFEFIGTTYVFPNDFTQGEVVTVTIVPFNEVGDAIGCTSESFTIRPIPTCTNLISPLNNATQVSVMSDVSWNPVFDADGYRVSVGTAPNGTDIVNNEDVASLTSYTFAEDLPSETRIYVMVIPYNTSGEATGCASDSFETEIIAPNCSTLISPANRAIDIPLETTISWEVVENATGYRLSLGTNPSGTDILDNLDVGMDTNYTPTREFPFDTEIYVTITPYNTVGDAEQCAAQSFMTLIPEDETKYGFSPDGDGINEYWHIDNIQYHPENVVNIYNRWGDMVFTINNYDNNNNVFEGTANMRTKMGAGQLPSGTYFFDIQIEGETLLKKTTGYLLLKR